MPEGPVAFYQTDRANRPAGLIQDQPRGLFTDFLVITIRQSEPPDTKIENIKQGLGNGKEETTTPVDLFPVARVGAYPGAGRLVSIQNSKG